MTANHTPRGRVAPLEANAFHRTRLCIRLSRAPTGEAIYLHDPPRTSLPNQLGPGVPSRVSLMCKGRTQRVRVESPHRLPSRCTARATTGFGSLDHEYTQAKKATPGKCL
jgi:hypothetical protein